ncbi:hypothetical protein PoB_005295900 [Plakobranchus ocellatus]|uniref:Uncharacterized protein n=1 Tax=Plakobranchus ocellatus TaxID=259542 RepID=A0AAV4C5Y0_9GAST|nr:hypothetical protein PoB_005295900 [Plakobranchus ocellatus]
MVSPQQVDLRLSCPPPGQGAGGGARTRDRRAVATVPPTPPYLEEARRTMILCSDDKPLAVCNSYLVWLLLLDSTLVFLSCCSFDPSSSMKRHGKGFHQKADVVNEDEEVLHISNEHFFCSNDDDGEERDDAVAC